VAERLLLQPPEIIDVNGPVIFLAGPIQGAPSWQSEATDIIHSLDPTIMVASPRKEYAPGTFKYNHQVDWETALLRRAGELGVVSFWLASPATEKLPVIDRAKLAASILLKGMLSPQRAYGQTSRFELAEWKMRHEYEGTKLTIGIEEGFGNARYIRRRFSQDCPDVKIADDLEAMCQNAVELVHQAT
jgi:hypothetical protein